MNLNYLECFLSLAKTLNFSETARQLSLTQPSVSRQIRLLETDLKTQLFIRDKHRVQLTAEGRELRTRISPLFEGIQNAFEESVEKARAIEGTIHFGCLAGLGQYFFYPMILEFQKLHPAVDFHIHYILQPEMIEMLKGGELDFIVVNDLLISENIRSYELFEERSVLVTRTQNRGHLALAEHVRDTHFVAFNPRDPILNHYLKTYLPPSDISRVRRLSSVNSHKSILEALLDRNCFSVLPYFTVQELIENGELKIASNKEHRQLFYLAHMETHMLPKKNEAFRKFILDSCKRRNL